MTEPRGYEKAWHCNFCMRCDLQGLVPMRQLDNGSWVIDLTISEAVSVSGLNPDGGKFPSEDLPDDD